MTSLLSNSERRGKTVVSLPTFVHTAACSPWESWVRHASRGNKKERATAPSTLVSLERTRHSQAKRMEKMKLYLSREKKEKKGQIASCPSSALATAKKGRGPYASRGL